MASELRTSRGVYRLLSPRPLIEEGDAVILVLALERVDGIERVGFQARIARELLPDAALDENRIVATLAPWIERDFEAIREAALKTIRSERRPLELIFDQSHAGPFLKSTGS